VAVCEDHGAGEGEAANCLAAIGARLLSSRRGLPARTAPLLQAGCLHHLCCRRQPPGSQRSRGASTASARPSDADTSSGEVTVLASGADFYSSPALSPDGAQLAWVQWKWVAWRPSPAASACPWRGVQCAAGRCAAGEKAACPGPGPRRRLHWQMADGGALLHEPVLMLAASRPCSHPNMPWDSTCLRCASVGADGGLSGGSLGL
jgi:hypothetical protein